MGARAEGQARLLFLLEHATGRAQQLNLYGQLAADPGFVNRDIELRRAVTTESLHKALATYLPADRRVVALVRPNRAAPRCGRLVEGR
jgi:predicted Zn-dependent peptidase